MKTAKFNGEIGALSEVEICGQRLRNVYGLRHILAVMSFLAFLCSFALRVNLSVAIVAMVEKSKEGKKEIFLDSCPFSHQDDHMHTNSSNTFESFSWDEKTQGLILGSFYYLYGISNIFGGRASDYFGGRILVFVGAMGASILTLLTPLASKFGAEFLIGVRILEGCFQGVMFPAVNNLIAKWYTTKERTKFTGFIFAGLDFGCVLTFLLSGWLCESEFLGGWSSAFYIPGVFTIIWGIFWFILIRDDPKIHPRISNEELKYILEGRPTMSEKNTYPVPWVSIISSKYFWSIVIAQMGTNFGYFVLLSELPTYLNNILHIPIKNNGIMTAMPYLASWIFSMIYSFSIDKAITSGKLSILSVRRLSMALSGYGPMLGFIGMCFVNCDTYWAFTILLMSGALNGAAYCGFFASYSDLAPRFTGTLMGFGSAFGCIGGFVGPAIVGSLTEGNQSITAWRKVFIVCAIIYGVATTVYEIFITTECQPWNEPKKTNCREWEEKDFEENFIKNNADSKLS